MNQLLDFLNNNSESKNFEKIKIFPNQNGRLCTLDIFHYDNGIPEQLKNILKKHSNTDKREILFDKRILAYKSYQQISAADITEEIEKEFDKLKQKRKN